MKKIFLNERGQAALMDSIFFLTIVSIICTSLFYFAINYGIPTEQQINSFYSRDFATDSLKVISYINVVRDGKSFSQVEDGGIVFENDYLLALVKEDYADKQQISSETRMAITRTLDEVMNPFDTSIDYAFFILSESEDEYLFLLLATHQCDGEGCLPPYEGEKDVERVYFYCNPYDNEILEKQIFQKVGKVDTALGKVTLSSAIENQKMGRPFIVGLSGWIVSDIPELNETNLTESPDFNCSIVDLTINPFVENEIDKSNKINEEKNIVPYPVQSGFEDICNPNYPYKSSQNPCPNPNINFSNVAQGDEYDPRGAPVDLPITSLESKSGGELVDCPNEWVIWDNFFHMDLQKLSTGCPGIRSPDKGERKTCYFGYNNEPAQWGDWCTTRAQFDVADKKYSPEAYISKEFGITTPNGYHWMWISNGLWELVKNVS